MYVQPDARGRIQLPQEYRKILLFQIENRGSELVLHPLHLQQRSPEVAAVQNITSWLNPEVSDLVFSSWPKIIEQWISKHQNVQAVILYGSRARGEALSSSDFDLALLMKGALPRAKQHELDASLEDALAGSLSLLRQHGVSGELSILCVSDQTLEQIPPAIYFSLCDEGRVLAERNKAWQHWCKEMRQFMTDNDVRKSGEGRQIKWTWRT